VTSLTYAAFELKRTFRNKRTFIFTLIFPLTMYFLIAVPNRHKAQFVKHYGVEAPLYFMVGLLGFGAMVAALAGGVRIAAERQVGWNRQLRLTPLSPRQYFRTKVMTSYVMVLISMALLYGSGIALGVRMPFSQWFHMSWLVLVSLVPFAAIGIGLGHLMTADAMGPVMGGGTSLFAFLGGTWFPITGNGAFVQFCQALPSYWLTDPWGAHGWIVIAAWSLVGAAFAMWAYRRDTQRV
jgi:ABC-2 type transport system permease protein